MELDLELDLELNPLTVQMVDVGLEALSPHALTPQGKAAYGLTSQSLIPLDLASDSIGVGCAAGVDGVDGVDGVNIPSDVLTSSPSWINEKAAPFDRIYGERQVG